MTSDIRDTWYTPEAFAPLLADPDVEGSEFLLRLHDEWVDGTNRFAADGEFLLGAYASDGLVAVGGISRDPYDPAPGLGRIRHVYVLKAHRRQGIGRMLVAALVERARHDYTVLRLRTRSVEASRIYESLGFVPGDRPNETHRLVL